jgi:hypothetical protein
MGSPEAAPVLVSIHAPPRGARRDDGRRADLHAMRFNPRAPTRGATVSVDVGVLLHLFQSTRPHEGRDRAVFGDQMRGVLFQSTRPHEGRDSAGASRQARTRRFNPRAPTRGATLASLLRGRLSAVSIHAPPRGARLLHSISLTHGAVDAVPREPATVAPATSTLRRMPCRQLLPPPRDSRFREHPALSPSAPHSRVSY